MPKSDLVSSSLLLAGAPDTAESEVVLHAHDIQKAVPFTAAGDQLWKAEGRGNNYR